MKEEIEEMFKEIKYSISEFLTNEKYAENNEAIEDFCDTLKDDLQEIGSEIDDLEEEIEENKFSLNYQENLYENSLVSLLILCKEIYETNTFSKENENRVNEIAMQTDNDSKLLWEHNKK